MHFSPQLQAYEVLAYAVKSEIEAADIYSKLYERVKNSILKQKLEFLIFEEKKHRQILEKLFSQRYPEKELQIPGKSFFPPFKVSLDESLSVLDLFKAAQKAEKASEEFYKEASRKSEDKTSQRILEYLSRVERSHYFMIESEIDLLEKFPDYYNVEEFHLGHDMVHIGP